MNFESDEARRRFTESRSAQLATASALGEPHIVPITFAVQDNLVYIAIDSKPKRSTNLRRLRNITENARVSVLADRYDDDWEQLWWVRGDGTARILTDEDDRRGPVELLQARYRQYVDDVPRGPVIAIAISQWSGWAFADEARLLA